MLAVPDARVFVSLRRSLKIVGLEDPSDSRVDGSGQLVALCGMRICSLGLVDEGVDDPRPSRLAGRCDRCCWTT